MVDRENEKLSISKQAKLLGLSRSSLYYQAQGESPENLDLMRLIDEQFLDTPYYGSRQMTRWLRRQGHEVNRKRVKRLMRLMGLSVIYQRPNTSKPHPEHKVYPYLLRDLEITRPNQVWCTDITYIPMRRGFLYLVAIMDWSTRAVLSWRLSNTMDSDFCVEALQEAVARYGKPRNLQLGPGEPVHELRVHERPEGPPGPDLHGRQRPMPGQRVHRAPVAIPEIRMCLPVGVRKRPDGHEGNRELDQEVQLGAAPLLPA